MGEEFRRDRAANETDSLLNCGYTVLRALCARSVVAAGLHPSIGVHHANRGDAFALTDDLIEPFRALVDSLAVRLAVQRPGSSPKADLPKGRNEPVPDTRPSPGSCQRRTSPARMNSMRQRSSGPEAVRPLKRREQLSAPCGRRLHPTTMTGENPPPRVRKLVVWPA